MSTAFAEQTFDQQRAEAFSGRMLEMINDGFVTLMTSIGHQTGLFDVVLRVTRAASIEGES